MDRSQGIRRMIAGWVLLERVEDCGYYTVLLLLLWIDGQTKAKYYNRRLNGSVKDSASARSNTCFSLDQCRTGSDLTREFYILSLLSHCCPTWVTSTALTNLTSPSDELHIVVSRQQKYPKVIVRCVKFKIFEEGLYCHLSKASTNFQYHRNPRKLLETTSMKLLRFTFEFRKQHQVHQLRCETSRQNCLNAKNEGK